MPETTTNGNNKQSIQHVAIRAPLKIERTFEGITSASLQMGEETYNEEVSVVVSKVAQGHVTNALASIRAQASVLTKIEKTKNPAVLRALATLLGAEIGATIVKALSAPNGPPKEPKEGEAAPTASPRKAS
jgi:hypothetical protein